MIYYRSYNYTTKNGLWFRILEFDICDIYIWISVQSDQRRSRLPLEAKMSASVNNHIVLMENWEQQYLWIFLLLGAGWVFVLPESVSCMQLCKLQVRNEQVSE
jgi:hypothetical protein